MPKKPKKQAARPKQAVPRSTVDREERRHPRGRPVVMVSSTVYGIEELLERIYTLLVGLGYEVWMSHKGTVPVHSDNHAFEDCLRAVEQCDLFLSIITPSYGSGKTSDPAELSITHRELKKAIELKKPRWLLAHAHVVFARTLLSQLGYPDAGARSTLKLKRSAVFDDLRVIDMYEDATLEHVVLGERRGNWVQKYGTDQDAEVFVQAQFSRYQDAEQTLREWFPEKVRRA